jgi:phage FluMu protein Com
MQMMKNNVDNTNFQAVPCGICNGLVEYSQQTKIDEKVFHKNCFKCQHCNKILLPATYAGIEGKFYCKPHFKQLFATKGNYSEGFGLEQHKNRWNPLNGAPAEEQDN